MKYLLVFICLFAILPTNAQTPYGNDWINFTQTYFKIKVAEDGIYRINQSQLQQAGVSISSINPKNIQMFYRGKEIALYVSGEDDNQFNNQDFIEFYGKKNDGGLDKPLYSNPNDQPHDYYSLYTDTSAYFLTWSATTQGKRYQNVRLSNVGLSPEPYFMYQAYTYFTDGGYYPGNYILAALSLSEYTEGEGFLGALISKGTSQIKTLSTPGLYTGTVQSIQAETYVAGRSNAGTSNSQGMNHHFRIEVSNNGSVFKTRKDTLFKAYQVAKNKFQLDLSDIGTTTYFRLSSIDDLGAETDYLAPGYIKVSYPRQYNLQGVTNLKFTLKGLNTGENSFVRFNNSSLANPVLLDLTNAKRIYVNNISNTIESVIPGAGTEKDIFLYDSLQYRTTTLIPVNFTNLNPSTSDKNFIIITNQSLLSKAQEYADYRDQTGYKTLLITTDQLYDQFYYGVHHALAIRNFAKFLLDKAGTKPQYLLLLGKGYSHSYLRSPTGLANDLVPTIGNPPSDNMFTSGLNGTTWEPAIPTGRVSARTVNDVEVYLQKLKMYEQQPDSLWRKNIIHVSGGGQLSENLQWSGYQKNFENISKGPYFGSNTINFHKFVNEPISDNLQTKIAGAINNGVAFLSFLGHGSTQATEVNLGEPEELRNQNKLMVYQINGCSAGNAFVETSIGEKFLLLPQKGAIGWLATTDEGVASYLASFTMIFYNNAFNIGYGKPIAENIKDAIKAYQRSGDQLNQAHCREYLWQGDPALKFYSPAKPDYYIENKDLFIYPENATAVSDSFAVAIIAKNLGKALNDSLSVSVKRTLPDNSIVTYTIKNFKPVYNTDTLFYWIKSNDVKTGGNNKFSVTLDANNHFDELSEANNTASFDFLMPSNGVNILYPKLYSIVGTPDIELQCGSNNLLSQNAEYLFEIDTVKNFNSSWKKSSGVINQGFIATWKPSFTPENNKVYYWRAKLNNSGQSEQSWQEGSFTYITHSPDGWNQSHIQQFDNVDYKFIHQDNITKKFKFDNTSFSISVQTRGDDASTADERTIRVNSGGRVGFQGYEFTGLSLTTFIPENFDTYSYPSPYNVDGYKTPSGEFIFNINNSVEVDSLIRYINNIPNGYFVVGYNGRNISLKDLPDAAKTALSQLGCSLFSTVGPGEPYMFWGQKGSAPGSAMERTADYSSIVPARGQLIKDRYEYPYPFDSGGYVSEKAGPSQKWTKAYYEFEKDDADQISLSLMGINRTGTESTLISSLPADSVDLSNIDANIYPYLRIKADVTDNINRTPAQLKSWKFLYDEYPEGTINPLIKNNFYSKTVQEGDSIKWELSYQNISKYITDSIQAYYTLTKSDRSVSRSYLGTYGPLKIDESLTSMLTLSTRGLQGINSLKFEFVPKNNQDSYVFNNILTQTFTVETDKKTPLVDVLFDGKHIINGEIISPRPSININLTDENQYILLNDTSVINVYLKRQDDVSFKRINYSDNKLMFVAAESTSNNKASVIYQPDKLEDGIYTLKIQGKDSSGNTNNVNDYLTDFEVINESSITNFYPYPNPFTTKMKFVFTLTGEKVPDKIKIQIMTISGKIVREIFKDELGPVHIGNNISEFTWDGTDQYGDRLANGVYFYHVITENSDNSELKHRFTAGDAFYKKGFGKIYLMR
ncbi:hypothetical protein FW774_09160 [Pedobacter sp. BS3]|uniref:putative type IX secretion system sortase PorU2 n=1 Tax=Pedobacter sp. BS3 TaxID=2567937 RepID=UPI0011EDADB9|nr:C25 family cysteine peptidase [Pedobacter sp. BS3]TZF83635.1 hypothetical protein FW774_09160 [Pedobacter sp. BS3]